MPAKHTAPLPAVPTINLASLMYGLDAYLRERGADPDSILARAGLAVGDLTDPERRVPLIRFLGLLEICDLPTMVDSAVYHLDVEGGMAFSYSYYIDPLMMTYRQKNDWGVAFVCNVIRYGLGEPDWAPTEVVLPQLAAESATARDANA